MTQGHHIAGREGRMVFAVIAGLSALVWSVRSDRPAPDSTRTAAFQSEGSTQRLLEASYPSAPSHSSQPSAAAGSDIDLARRQQDEAFLSNTSAKHLDQPQPAARVHPLVGRWTIQSLDARDAEGLQKRMPSNRGYKVGDEWVFSADGTARLGGRNYVWKNTVREQDLIFASNGRSSEPLGDSRFVTIERVRDTWDVSRVLSAGAEKADLNIDYSGIECVVSHGEGTTPPLLITLALRRQ